MLTLTLVILIATSAVSQNDSGIFLTIKCGKKVPRETLTLSQAQVCLANSPIILPSEFVSISDIRVDNQKVSFDLGLSPKAVEKLKRLAANLPSAEFALVVEKEAFMVFPANKLSVNRTFRFEGQQADMGAFLRIQEKLKSAIPDATQ
jgi:hypothetical protein